jgi:hypothetical protein
VIHDDTSRYDDIDEAGAREAFHAWCSPPGEQVFTIADILANPDASKVWTRADLPVSEWVCLMVDEQAMRGWRCKERIRGRPIRQGHCALASYGRGL